MYEEHTIIISTSQMEKKGFKKLGDLPEVTQLVKNRTEVWIYTVWLQNPC